MLKWSLCLSFLPLLIINNSAQAQNASPIISQKRLEDITLSNNSSCGSSKKYNQATVLFRIGPGSNNVVQGLALDSKKRTLYSLHVTGNPEAGVLNRFMDIDGKDHLVALDYQKPSSKIGHQGITLIPDTDWLLSSSGKDITNNGWYISLFKYTPYATPKSVSLIQVFSKGYSKSSSSMPVVSPDAVHLLVRGRKNNHNIIRVFNLKNLDLSKKYDISKEPNVEWQVDDTLTNNDYYFQAITADKKFIYILSGRAGKEPKRLHIYTFSGKLVTKLDNITLGENDALESGIEAHWEPEGLTIDNANSELFLLFAVGDKGKRLGNVYKLKLHKD